MKVYIVLYSYKDDYDYHSIKGIFENVFKTKDEAIHYIRDYALNSVAEINNSSEWNELLNWNYNFTELEFPGWTGIQKLTIIEKEL